MDILFLLVPLSVALVFFILAGLWWAVYGGQFEDIEDEATRILDSDWKSRVLDMDQVIGGAATGNSHPSRILRSQP